MRRVLTILLVLAISVGAVPALAANPEEARIAATRADLQAVRDELEAARAAAADDKIELADADRQLQAAFDAVEAASRAVERQQSAVDDAEARLEEAQRDLTVQRELMAERVGEMYTQARPDSIITVLGAESVTDAVRQSTYINAIGRDDRAQIETLDNAERVVEAEKRAVKDEQIAMGRVLEEQEALLADVEELRADKALVAAASQDLVARLEAREHHLESEAAELARLARERAAQVAAQAAASASQTAVMTSTVSASGNEAAQAAAPGAAEAPAADEPGAAEAQGDSPAAAGAPAEAPAPEPEPEPAPPAPSGGGFSWPTQGTVTSEFGPRWGRMHDGLDIANAPGTAIAAAKGGTVIQAGPYSGYGNLVLIAHGGGFVTAYAHMSSIAVSNGQSVSTGTYLGGMGCSGSCTGTHLHFEIRANGTAVNPRNYL